MKKDILRVYSSPINKKLKIYREKGKKTLNTANTNYSYGGLQEVLNKGLSKIPIDQVDTVLVLGMGGGCVVDSLRNKFDYQGPIVGVELDPVVIKIAEKEFHLSYDADVEIIQADGKRILAHHPHQYDLIVVDVFVDLIVPEKFYSPRFWKKLEDRVTQNGFVLFNAGIDLSEEKMEEFIEIIPSSFVYLLKTNVLESNTLFILQKVFE